MGDYGPFPIFRPTFEISTDRFSFLPILKILRTDSVFVENYGPDQFLKKLRTGSVFLDVFTDRFGFCPLFLETLVLYPEVVWDGFDRPKFAKSRNRL